MDVFRRGDDFAHDARGEVTRCLNDAVHGFHEVVTVTVDVFAPNAFPSLVRDEVCLPRNPLVALGIEVNRDSQGVGVYVHTFTLV